MSEGYVKVLSSIMDSSIWAEPDDVVKVWMTMLAMANKDGYVGASVGGIARRTATVSEERVAECLEKFQQPDTDSRTTDHEGRRIARVDRGWLILNYRKIRDMHGKEAKLAAKRNWWLDNRGMTVEPESPRTDGSSESSMVLGNGSDLNLHPDLNSSLKRSVKTRAPESLVASEATLRTAVKFNRDWQLDWESCRDWAWSKGETRADWQATLRTWMKKASEYKQSTAGGFRGSSVKTEKWGEGRGSGPQPNDPNHRIIPNRIEFTKEELESGQA
jgi:hypothetical protein